MYVVADYNKFNTQSLAPFRADFDSFLAIYKHSSVSKAAEELSKDQGNLSRGIMRLEDRLGKKLFLRFKDGMHPTQEAQALYSTLIRMNEVWGQMLCGQWKSTDPTYVKIGIHQSLANAYLGKIVKNLSEMFPRSFPQIVFCSSLDATRRIQSRELDLAVVANLIRSEDLVVRPVAKEKILLCSRGTAQNPEILFKNSKMLHIQQLLKSINAQKIVEIDDYDVAASMCRESKSYACIIPSTVLDRHRLNAVRELRNRIDIKAITFPGSVVSGKMQGLLSGI